MSNGVLTLSTVLILGAFLASAPFAPNEETSSQKAASLVDPECDQMAWALRKASQFEARADFWRTIAVCLNDPTMTVPTMVAEAQAVRDQGLLDAEEQFTARLSTCTELGHGPYDPTLAPSAFVASCTNPYFPVPGNRVLTFELDSPDYSYLVRIKETGSTVLIDSVPCTEVVSEEFENGELVERTTDWYAQKQNGDVWYFGETSAHYEEGFLNDLEGSWRSGKDDAKAGIRMPGNPQVGMTYRMEFKAGDAEDIAKIVATNQTVTVASGTYTGCLKIEEWSPLENELEIKYYAPGVGFVLEINPVTGERLELMSIETN